VAGRILVGATSWTDRTLLASEWYPKAAKTPEARLKHYASQFPVVEVDSTYYAPPSERNAVLWVERTPAHFTFDVKAYALMTQHPTRVASLPKDMREAAGAKARVYQKDLPKKVVDEVWEMFRSALMPLHSAGKLGYVLFQFPEWFVPSPENKDYVIECAARLPDYRCAIELRQRTWMEPERNAERTIELLSAHDLPYVCVDMPQGFRSSVPPVAEVTARDLAVVRFHGRDPEAWARKDATAAERFRYLYEENELEDWVPRIEALAKKARRVHAMFNNCWRDSAVRNAKQLAGLLGIDAGGSQPDLFSSR
jgi:uncharacterized protein YecE (DUF72 family)